MKIGNIEIENCLALGPMAGVTDLPFRLLCKEMGCNMLYTEMVSAKAILYKNKNTKELLNIDKNEHPVGVQLFGSDPDIMAQIAAQVEEGECDFIDINMGCPVPKIVNNGEGSALLKQPKLVEEILTKMVKAVNKPVTVKIRKGFENGTVYAVEIAKIAESCGVSAIAVHGRTREQYYSGKADWDVIKDVKKAVKIPVIGNGDIFSAEDAKAMKEYTGCDGLMVARGARGNPWIFREIKEYLENGNVIDKPKINDIREMIIRHAKMLVDYKGEYTGIREMRKHIAWYTAGLPHSAELRRMCNQIETMENLIETVNAKLQ
ncbi:MULTISPECIES: tRNA dihydrouridine synthase DusB [unclassified Eubacterium (in: firmicutes)]|jgi:tRNA-dihydrouridine synthase B|uniref:tRNA dihydrouridine synthase DusB n=1 Tax=unclassified Eubacterium (in: firmicutes) TaxID=2624479 RepID=UPI000E509051|nr:MULTISPECIES: tRNA dihydrouridine synthase DusB [unclassified Eubacterium (in: firmicutes)]RGG67327.1 tRNA dihydrouridine synthase DusB [Eubacterium sp. AF17-7]RHR37156.1 tRNA dihydrouridine synthase DusB [Eubacterium sp. AF19-12LB]